MATVSKELALNLLDQDGNYYGDPEPHSIWSYVSPYSGKTQYSVCYVEIEVEALMRGTRFPTKLWDRDGRITRTGQALLDRENT